MKNKFEQNFRDILQGHEEPFDPTAWEQMSASLDASMPVQGTEIAQGAQGAQGVNGLSSLSKLILIGSTTTAVVVGSYFVIKSMDNDKVDNKVTTVKELDNSNTPGPDEFIVTPGPDSIPAPGPDKTNTKGPDTQIITEEIKLPEQNKIAIEESGITEIPSSNEDTDGPDTAPIVHNSDHEKYEINNISDMCLGNTQKIENTNSISIYVRDNKNSEWEIASNKSLSFAPKNDGFHQIGIKLNGQFEEIVEFEVSETVSNAFEMDHELKYVNGLPTMTAKAISGLQSTKWSISGLSGTTGGRKIMATFFRKGSYDISLEASDLFGCDVKETKTFYVKSDYNLLAPNAFTPNSSDSRKNRFIPYALTQRDVSFQMIILDKKGGMVYQTSDSSSPWDGIDTRTGQMVNKNSVFIWKVVLINPAAGEPKEYRGTITRM
jgi:hypothetical protein